MVCIIVIAGGRWFPSISIPAIQNGKRLTFDAGSPEQARWWQVV